MNFEKSLQPPTPKELEDLIKYYNVEELQVIHEEIGKDIALKKEKMYAHIKNDIISGKAQYLKEDVKQFFLDNLKEEDFELASQLIKT